LKTIKKFPYGFFPAAILPMVTLGILYLIASNLRSRTILYYDEVLDIEPIYALSQGCDVLNEFSGAKVIFDCFPILASTQYQGTLRAFLFYPLVKLDLLNAQSLVLVNLTLFIFTIWILYFLFLNLSKRKLLSLTMVILFAIQPAVWTLIVFDLGPVSTQITVRSLLLLSVWNDIKKQQICSKSTLVLSALLIWGKLDGIWFVGGLIAGQLFALNWEKYKKAFNLNALLLISGCAFSGVTAYLISHSQNSMQLSVPIKTKLFSQGPTDLLSGITNLVVPNANSISKLLSIPFIVLFCAALLRIFNLKSVSESVLYQFYSLLRVLNLIILIFWIITPRATAPWHTNSFFPSSIAMICCWIALIRENNNSLLMKACSKEVFTKLISSTVSFSILFSVVASTSSLIQLQSGKLNPLFSENLAVAFNRIQLSEKSNHALIFSSWGIHGPVVMDNSFSKIPTSTQVIDAWPWFSGGVNEKSEDFFQWHLSEGKMSKYSTFTFVEINPSSLGSSGYLQRYVTDSMKLCVISAKKIKISQSGSYFMVVEAQRSC
jgi:hypothetical protein